MKIGFACLWDTHNREQTWSGTPWNLRAELSRLVTVADVGPEFGRFSETMFRAAFARKRHGRWVSEWTQSRVFDLIVERQVRSRSFNLDVDAVLQVMDYAITDTPYHLYQDLSHRLILERFRSGMELPDEFNRLSVSRLEAGADRQLEMYEHANSIVCMSAWLARDVVAGGVEQSRVHVVPPGVTDYGSSPRPLDQVRSGSLVMVGRDALRKGLASVVAALPAVREQFPGATLSVIGPSSWPLQDQLCPDYVRVLGPMSGAQVAHELRKHDLFVMPSQWEGFGIAFCEALVAGLPLIGRNDCAMPEIIQAPKYGEVVGSNEDIRALPGELAVAIVRCLSDDALYQRVSVDRAELKSKYSWATAAENFSRILAT